ncbi:MAG: DUF4249 domain-containing protein [Bacteroidetes bacterium]|nr:DUF4249 domain-containing protein [Bacteroidota bacterium]
MMQKLIKYPIFIIALTLCLTACERVIDIDLNEDNPMLVVDGNLTNLEDFQTILLTRTGSYFGGDNLENITGAEVAVTDNEGNRVAFTESPAGVYKAINFKTAPEITYTLNINSEGKTYTAVSKMLNAVPIDSLSYIWKERSFGTPEGNYISVNFSTIARDEAYYWIAVEGDSAVNIRNSSPYFLVNNFGAVGTRSIELPFYTFKPGYATIKLHTLDKEAFDYYNNLNEIITNPGQNPFTGIPQNPTTNIKGGALGFFGTVATSVDSILIK